jgi:hypothetical protein
VDARRALLTALFDHAAMFPPASMPVAAALDEDRRARQSADAWLLGRFVCPATALADVAKEPRDVSVVAPGVEFDGDIYLEGVPLDDVAALRRRAHPDR